MAGTLACQAPSAPHSETALVAPPSPSSAPSEEPASTLTAAPDSVSQRCQNLTQGQVPLPQDAIQTELWSGGAKAAVSLTIDEGTAEPFELLLPEIELFGWRASVYI